MRYRYEQRRMRRKESSVDTITKTLKRNQYIKKPIFKFCDFYHKI